MSVVNRVSVLALALVGALGIPSAATQAATATDTFQVSITVENSCAIVANDLNFGTVNTLAANVDASSTVVVTCTNAGPLKIAFNAGTGTGSTLVQRKLVSGTNTIDYNLYTTAARTVILGDDTSGTGTLNGTSTGAADSFTVYGRVTAGQNPKPVGTYTSDVIATVTF